MSAVAKRQQKDAVTAPVHNETASIFSVIERIAAQPDIPMERVQAMFDFYQKVQGDQARRAYHAAFAEMQPSLPPVERKGKGHNNTKHARLEDMITAVNPVLKQHGFGLGFDHHEVGNKVLVRCTLSHRDGHAEFVEYAFPADTSGNKNPIQAIGSALTYGKRYTLASKLGLASGDEVDDDGKASGPSETISEAQFVELSELIQSANATPIKFCETFGIESVGDLPAKRFNEAKARLQARIIELGKSKP